MTEDLPATHADLAEVAAEVRALTRTVAAAMADRGTHSGGQAVIHVNAGGAALWVAVTCCAVMLVSALFLAGVVYWCANKTNDQGHQMNALYQSVPGLRELVERQMRLIDQTSKPKPEQTR